MTALGKLFVIANVGLSFLLATIAFGLYATRIDWTTTPAKGDSPAGEVGELQKRIREAQAALVTPRANWKAARDTLLAHEKRRAGDRQWFVEELQNLRTGNTNIKPIRTLVYPPGQSVPASDPNDPDRPLLGPGTDIAGQPLHSLREYNAETATVRNDIRAVLKDYEAEVAKDNSLTAMLIGTESSKGLQARLREEQAKKKRLEEEFSLTKPLLINAVVESELIFKRQRSLMSRIKELGGEVKVSRR
jgi:hypothetical protein